MRPHDLIVTHPNADFDALGAALAARRLYPEAVIRLPGGVNRNVRAFIGLHAEELGIPAAARVDLSCVRRVIAVEAGDPRGLADIGPALPAQALDVILFDHHGQDAEPEWVTPGSMVASADGALSATLALILAERGIEPTPAEATALALGIHEDTGSLTHITTTPRDVEALAWCLRHGASQQLIGEFLRLPLTPGQRELMSALVDSAHPCEAGGVEVLVCRADWPHHVAAVSTLATKIAELTDARALVIAVRMEERVFVVGRSRTPLFDVGRVLETVGGGGHAAAASAVVHDRGLDAVCAQIEHALGRGVASTVRAADVMSSPAWFVDAGASVAEAMAECRRRHTSGVQVESAGMLAGAVTREDLDRALGHELGHAPVRAVMSGEVPVVGPAAGLAEVQAAVTAARAGRVAVVREPQSVPHAVADVLGVVTRSDLLEAFAPQRAEPQEAPAADVSAELAGRPELERVWRAVAAAGSGGEGVYLVGGAVRDLFLGAPSFDVDLAVEGDGIAFAQALARVLDGRMHPHERFHTAVVIAGDLRVDVATARTEHYEHPAALPQVERSSILPDLRRRDFSINAMAIAVDAPSFGRLLDPYGGRADLASGVLRVLHNLSFIEDPTRIFRAVRYEARLGFRMDPHTEQLATSTVSMGLVGEVSGARLRDELVAILEADGGAAALARMRDLGLIQALHPALDASPGALAVMERVDALTAGALLPVRWRVRLAALARGVGADGLEPWLLGLRMRKRDARAVALAAVLAPRLVQPLEAAATPAEVAELLAPHPPDVSVLAAALGSRAAQDYLDHGSAVALDIDGDVLRREFGLPPSPRVGAVLAELLRQKQNGLIESREQELAAAHALLGEDEA